MSQIKEVLRLHHEAKLAYSQIAFACGLSKGAVSKYLSLAKAQGIGWPLPPGMDEAQLESRLFTDNKRSMRFIDFGECRANSSTTGCWSRPKKPDIFSCLRQN